MRNRLLLLLFAPLLAANLIAQSDHRVVLTVVKTTPTSGHQMFAGYCAPCHGINGRGDGPLAPALRRQPADLTRLRSFHHGKFPEPEVVSVLQFGAPAPPHRASEMPAWGPILAKMDQHQDRLLRISNLSRYLDAMQVH